MRVEVTQRANVQYDRILVGLSCYLKAKCAEPRAPLGFPKTVMSRL